MNNDFSNGKYNGTFRMENKSFAVGSFSFSTDGTAACHTGTETRHQSKMGMVYFLLGHGKFS
jgi:hypothetical protein